MREAANILDRIAATLRSGQDRAFVEAIADAVDALADDCSLDGLIDCGLIVTGAVDAYHNKKEDA